MGDLLLLDYSLAPNAELIGVDLDQESLNQAAALAEKRGLAERTRFLKADAWSEKLDFKADILTSNGLNIYEPDDVKVGALYANFHRLIKPGGILLVSFITPAPGGAQASPWDLSEIDARDMAQARMTLGEVVPVKWRNARAPELTERQLRQAGFDRIELLWDRARIFPTALAYKK
jgi:SAM-dependent methyltransferase